MPARLGNRLPAGKDAGPPNLPAQGGRVRLRIRSWRRGSFAVPLLGGRADASPTPGRDCVRAERPPGRFAGKRRASAAGFTLIEMLVVIAIIGVLAAIGLPALRGLGRSNQIDASNRQVLDDLWLARALAMNNRTTVYMVFVPPNAGALFPNLASLPPRERLLVSNVVHGQYTDYALLSLRTVGDQPGQGHPRYLTPWKSLPDGMLFATDKFAVVSSPAQFLASTNLIDRPLLYTLLPFPTADSKTNLVPCLAFNAQGQLVNPQGQNQLPLGWDVVLPLVRGSVFYENNVANVAGDLKDTNDLIQVSWLTGRAIAVKPEFR